MDSSYPKYHGSMWKEFYDGFMQKKDINQGIFFSLKGTWGRQITGKWEIFAMGLGCCLMTL